MKSPCLLAFCAALTGASTCLHAAADADASEGRAPLQFGGVMLHPELKLRTGHDDNVTLAPTGEVSSSFYESRVGVSADYLHGQDRYMAGYDNTYTHYWESATDSVDNQTLWYEGQHVLTTRNTLDMQLKLRDGYDARGSTDRYRLVNEGTEQSSPDHFRLFHYGATYGYGSAGAAGRLELDAFRDEKRYLNNRDSTRTADVESTELAARFLYRVLPKTSLLLEVRDRHHDYTASDAGLDNRERQYLVGATWQATAKTTGNVRIGRHERDYSQFRSDYGGATWDASVSWTPLTYSRFDFSSGRQTNDPVSGLVDTNYLLTTSYGVRWTHEWSGRLRSEAGFEYQQIEYDERAAATRDDHVRRYRLGLYYDWRRWLNAGIETYLGDRDSVDFWSRYTQRRTQLVFEFRI